MDYPVPLILREEPNYGRISRKKSIKCWLKVAYSRLNANNNFVCKYEMF